MKYIVHLSSRPILEEPAEEKHAKLIKELQNIDMPWGIPKGNYPFPEFKTKSRTVFVLNKLLGPGIKGDVSYRYRRMLDDDGSNDDIMDLEFNSNKINYKTLIDEVFKQYIDAFDPYFGYIFNEEIIFADFERSRYKNLRNTIIRYYPVFFVDELFSVQAIGLKLDELYKILKPHVLQADYFHEGLLIIASDKILTLQESNDLDSKLSTLIGK